MNDNVFTRLINELKLKKQKRMAVFYFNSIGDFYSLCSSARYAEQNSDKEYILLYYKEAHKEMLSWFCQDGISLKSHYVSKEDNAALYNVQLRNQFLDYFVFWDAGDEQFRKYTRNISPDYMGNSELPKFPVLDTAAKYSEYIVPQKTVLIIPEAGAVTSPPPYFWNFAAEMFRYMGYSVVFNADPKKSTIYNGKCILVPLSEIVNFANECGNIFAIRTGLVDVLSTSTAKMIIFSTKFYKALDKVYKIPNEDMRINTVFFDDKDPYFERFTPVSLVMEYFKEYNSGLYRLLAPKPIRSYENKYADSVVSYGCKVPFNRFDRSIKIKNFTEVKYTFNIENDCLHLSMYDLNQEIYRFDYIVFCNDRVIAKINNLGYNSFSLNLNQSGEYYVKVFITEKRLCCQEYFETETLYYTANVPICKKNLPDCQDMYSYILALKAFLNEICIFIVSRDAHTRPSKSKDTAVLQTLKLLRLEMDFEDTYRSSYIGIIDGGNIVKELYSADQTITDEYKIDSNIVLLESSGYNAVQNSKTSIKIDINGKPYAVDKRGLNFVVWDKKQNKLIDSVAFDSFNCNIAYRKKFD